MFVTFDENIHHRVMKRYGDEGRLIPAAAINIDKDMVEGTILDPILAYKQGFIRLPSGITNNMLARSLNLTRSYKRENILSDIITNTEIDDETKKKCITMDNQHGIQLPIGINHLYLSKSGQSFLDDIQSAAYRVIAECVNYSQNLTSIYSQDTDFAYKLNKIDQAVNKYFEIIGQKIAGKQGILRETLYPRSGLSIFGVAANRIDCPIDSVFLPRKTLRTWLKNEEYAAKIKAPNNWPVLRNKQFDALFAHERVLLVGMPDHDENCVFSMKIKVWSCDGIGLNPAIAMAMGRDFDGDLLFCKAFLTKSANEEMEKFSTHAHLSAIKESLGKVYRGCGNSCESVQELERAIQIRSREVEFTSTSLESASKVEGVSNIIEERFNNLIDGMTDDEILETQSTAAQDFYIIKSETASAGDIGNLMRVLASKRSEEYVQLANKFYHFLAQNALDAKHNTRNVSKIISDILRNADNLPSTKDSFVDIMKHLIPTDTHDTIPLLSNIFYDKNNNPIGSIVEIYNKESKLGSIIRGNYSMIYGENSGNDSLVEFLKILHD